MDEKQLKRHRALMKEISLIEWQLDKLYDRKMGIPIVMGKVTGSSHDFPYTPVRTSVEMQEPEQADGIDRLIRIKKELLAADRKEVVEIEEFICAIEEPVTRQIFEMTFYEGMKQREVAEHVGYSRGRVSQIIKNY